MNPHENGQEEFDRPPTNREILRDIQSTVKKLAERSAKVDIVVFGDDESKIEGLVDKVERHRKYISMDKRLKWIGAGSLVAGGTGMGFWESIKQFFLK